MRYVPLRQVPIRLPGVPDEAPLQVFDYAGVLLGLLNAWAMESERGLPLTEVAKGVKLATAIEEAQRAGEPNLALEDGDWQSLNTIVQGFKGWRIIHPCVSEFVTAVSMAPTTPAAPQNAAPAPEEPRRRGKPRRAR